MNYNKVRLKSLVSQQSIDAKRKRRDKTMANTPATPRQIECMKKLGIEIPKGCSKQKASNLISYKLNLK